MSEQLNFETEVLGPCKIDSPVKISSSVGDNIVDYTTDDQCILYNIDATYSNPIDPASLQRISVAGPRQKIYFNPSHVNAGIVTCWYSPEGGASDLPDHTIRDLREVCGFL